MTPGQQPQVKLPDLGPSPSVSVIIPVRNAQDTLEETVSAALQPEVEEVVLVVGPSSDASQRVAGELEARHASVRVVDNPSGRTPDALNLGIAATRGQVIVRVDAHSQLPAGYVRQAVEILRQTNAGNVGGRQVPAADTSMARAIAAAMASRVGAGGAAHRTGRRPGPADTVYLGVFRREALDAVGGFDTRFERNQDAELNIRLRRAGFEVWFDPGLAVSYRPRPSLVALATQYRQYGRWRRLTARTHRRSLAVRQVAPPLLLLGLLGSLGLSVVTRDTRPVAVAWGGYIGFLSAAGIAAAPDARTAPRTAAALGTMHLAWAVGFLQGPPDSVEGIDDAGA